MNTSSDYLYYLMNLEVDKEDNILPANSKEEEKERQAVLDRIATTEKDIDAVKGCIFGGVIGDALGFKADNADAEICKFKVNDDGKNIFSDHSKIMLFYINALIMNDVKRYQRCYSEYIDLELEAAYDCWLYTQFDNDYCTKKTNLPYYNKGKDSWLLHIPEMYSNALKGTNYDSPQQFIAIIDKNNCAGLLHLTPEMLHYRYDDISELYSIVYDMEWRIYHNNSIAISACAYCHLLNKLMFTDANIFNIMEEITACLSKHYADEEARNLIELLDLAVELSQNDADDVDNIKMLGAGADAKSCLAIALYCSIKHKNDFMAGISAAMNSCNSCVISSLTGYILGLMLGYNKIDKGIIDSLELTEVIDVLANDLCFGFRKNLSNGFTSPSWKFKYLSRHFPLTCNLKGLSKDYKTRFYFMYENK